VGGRKKEKKKGSKTRGSSRRTQKGKMPESPKVKGKGEERRGRCGPWHSDAASQGVETGFAQGGRELNGESGLHKRGKPPGRCVTTWVYNKKRRQEAREEKGKKI